MDFCHVAKENKLLSKSYQSNQQKQNICYEVAYRYSNSDKCTVYACIIYKKIKLLNVNCTYLEDTVLLGTIKSELFKMK